MTDRSAWEASVRRSDVRLQWDPDHDPLGQTLDRRAIQLGLRGPVLASYARDWIRSIEDVTPFVQEQREVLARGGIDALVTSREDVYPCAPELAERIGCD